MDSTRVGYPPAVSEGQKGNLRWSDPPVEVPTFNPSDGPAVTVDFSASAVIFEEAYVDGPGVSRPRRSTRTRLTVSAWGGPDGGTLALTSRNLDKLSPVACGPMILPPQLTLAPYQPWSILWNVYEVDGEIAEPVGIFAENTCQTIRVSAMGTVGVHKLNHVAERTIQGACRTYDENYAGSAGH